MYSSIDHLKSINKYTVYRIYKKESKFENMFKKYIIRKKMGSLL